MTASTYLSFWPWLGPWSRPQARRVAGLSLWQMALLDALVAEVSVRRGVGVADMLSDSRAHGPAHARHEAMALAQARVGLGCDRLGWYFRLDRATVRAGIRAHWRRAEAA